MNVVHDFSVLVHNISKWVCKFTKLNLHFYEFILPQEYVCRKLIYMILKGATMNNVQVTILVECWMGV